MTRAFVLTLLLTVYAAGQPGQRDIRVETGGRKIALAIGNAAYPKWPLVNPTNDARDIGAVLQELGFDAEVVLNANLKTLEQAVDRFVGKLLPRDVALFYYAGHGVQLSGENYLVPVDFNARDEADAKYVAYSASRLHDRMAATGATLNIVILDACRNNPFRTSRSASAGLAAMNSGRGAFIAFSTAPGKTANDNPSGRNGLFTASLVETLRQPGLSLDQVFTRVRQRVYEASSEEQLPWTASSVIGDFYFNQRGVQAAAPQAAAPRPSVSQPAAVNPLARNPLARQADEQPILPVPEPPATAQAAAANAFLSGDPDQFESAAAQEIAAGRRLTLPLAHHHTFAGIHASALVLDGSGLTFDPLGNPCSQPAVTAKYADIVNAQLTVTQNREQLLNLRVRDPKNPKRTLTFNFATADSVADTSTGVTIVMSPPQAPFMLRALSNVLRKHSGR
jgi:hypothetical protein